jgi:hypothetical protein
MMRQAVQRVAAATATANNARRTVRASSSTAAVMNMMLRQTQGQGQAQAQVQSQPQKAVTVASFSTNARRDGNKGQGAKSRQGGEDFWSNNGVASLDRSKHEVPDAERRLQEFIAKYPLPNQSNKGNNSGSGKNMNKKGDAPAPSTSDAPSSSKARLLPSSMHSARHFPGPLCAAASVNASTQMLLDREFGSLYQPLTGVDEDEHIFQLRAQVEFLIKGHAACLPDSYLQRQVFTLDESSKANADATTPPTHANKKVTVCWDNAYFDSLRESVALGEQDSDKFDTAQAHLQSMIALLERIEEEARLYWTRKQSQIVLSKQEQTYDSHTTEEAELTNTGDEEANDNDNAAVDNHVNPRTLYSQYGPPPGPSTTMYDLVLDGYAAVMKLKGVSGGGSADAHADESEYYILDTLEQVKDVQQRALQRYEFDGGAANTNPHTMVSTMTLNAPLRVLSLVPYSHAGDASDADNNENAFTKEQTRDAAIELAFSIYTDIQDRYRHDKSLRRNSATYVYMLRVINKFIPDSRSKGNIAYAVFCHASEEDHSVNQAVWDVVMKEYLPNSAGPDLMAFQTKHKAITKLSQLPKFWCQRNQQGRYQAWDDGSY